MKRLVTAYWLCAFLVMSITIEAGGVDTYWQTSGSGDWATATNWTNGEPTAGNDAIVTNGGTANITSTSKACANLILGEEIGETGRVTIDYGFLPIGYNLKTKYSEYIGYHGTGYFTQKGGVHCITDDLVMGKYKAGTGTYTINDGTLDVQRSITTGSGSSTLIINGGTISVGGGGGIGSGVISVDTLRLGSAKDSDATFTMSADNDFFASDVHVGAHILNGNGHFIQNGGTATISNDLTLGYWPGSSGSYRLSGGALNVTGSILGGSGSSSLTLNSGQINADDISIDTFTIAYKSGANVTHTLNSGEQISVTNERIGKRGTGTLTQNGGTNTVTGTLKIGDAGGGKGTYNLNNGTLTANTIDVECYGTTKTSELNWTSGTLNAGTINVNERGRMNANQSHTFNGTLNINSSISAGGVADFGKHSLTLDKAGMGPIAQIYIDAGRYSELYAGTEYIGFNNEAVITQNGGTHTVSGDIYLGYFASGDGTYNISKSTMSAESLYVGKDGRGEFNIISPYANITVSELLSFGSNSEFTAVADSVIHMTGSAFENFNIDPADLLGLSNLELIFEGGIDDIDPFEVAGAIDGGFTSNFALGALTLGGVDVGMVQLVDDFDNGNRGGNYECLYLHELLINEGSSLDINGLNLYVYGDVESLLDGWITDGRLFSSMGLIDAVYDISNNWTVVPEPATLLLFGLGGLALRKRKR